MTSSTKAIYEDVAKHEYLDLSHRQLGYEGVLSVVEDLIEDKILRHVNLSYNILLEEWDNPKHVETFFRKLKRLLIKNQSLTALDLAGNFLFYYHPHPSNEHVKHYEKELANLLRFTGITRIDISDNCIAGYTGRELDGLLHFMTSYAAKKQAFSCRGSLLSSQGLLSVTQGLGVYSSLTYLDVSDNLAGRDPWGQYNKEGVAALAEAMIKSMQLQIVRIARNHLLDEHVELLGEAIQHMPQFLDLDLAGNLCKKYGCRALKIAIASHGVQHSAMMGFRYLNLCNNPIGDEGALELCFAVERTNTMRELLLHGCQITDVGGAALQKSMAKNASIHLFAITENLMSPEQESQTRAEAEANQLLEDIKANPLEVDAFTLTPHMYSALAKKLRYLDNAVLKVLHSNPSFNSPGTDMMDELHILEPPPRRVLIQEVKTIDSSLQRRLQQSKVIAIKVEAAMRIFNAVMRWYSTIMAKKSIANALSNAMRKEDELRMLFMGEDNMSLGSEEASQVSLADSM